MTAARGTEPHGRGRAHLHHPAAGECSTRGRAAGIALVELLLVLLFTLVVMAAVLQATRAAHLLHAREVRRTERSMLALRAVEEMAREIDRAGFGLGGDVVAVVPSGPGGSAGRDGISIRSNPGGLIGVLRSDVRPGGERAEVGGAEVFHPGDRVFLTDTRGPPVPAIVTAADSRTLTFRDTALPAWPPRRKILANRAGRVRPYHEVSYFPLEAPGEERPVLARTIDGSVPTILARGVEQLRFEYRDDAGRLLNPVRLPRAGPRFVGVHLELGDLRELPATDASITLPAHGGAIAFDERRVRLRLREMLEPVNAPADVGSLAGADMGWVLFRDGVNGGSRAVSYVLERDFFDARVGSVLDLPGVPPPLALLTHVSDPGCPGCLWFAAEGARGLEAWRLRPDSLGAISPDSPLERVLQDPELRGVAGVTAGYEERTLFVADRRSSGILRVRVGSSPEAPLVDRLVELKAPPKAIASGCEGSLWVLLDGERSGDPSALVEIPLDDEGRPGPTRVAARFRGNPRGLAVDPIRGWLYVVVREVDDSVVYELPPDSLGAPAAPPQPVFRLRLWLDAVRQDPSLLFRVVDESKGTVAEVEVVGEDGTKKTEKQYKPYVLLLPTRLSGVAFDQGGSLFLMGEDMPVVLRFHLGRPRAARNRAGIAAVPVQERDGAMRLRLLGWAMRPGAETP